MIIVCNLCMVFLLPIFICAEDVSSVTHGNAIKNTYSTKTALDWTSDRILNVIESLIPDEQITDGVEGRKKGPKMNQFIIPLLIGFLLIKSILLPIALKFLAVLSGKAVVLSLMSLILAAIVGLRQVAQNVAQSAVSRRDSDVYLPLSKYRRKDILDIRDNFENEDSFGYYKERRRRK
ncbi:uncharacterized protein LOC117182693 [Belonocnema kinseyi]|uniref:uncharacterized protein LOC117182693 n=1 Tax=Belonocnema kinseyi TaxID=2817044 RepID=UPI00143D2648|nr:uncharacterized protein LOC117182693 [Belonocnema kinseyi]